MSGQLSFNYLYMSLHHTTNTKPVTAVVDELNVWRGSRCWEIMAASTTSCSKMLGASSLHFGSLDRLLFVQGRRQLLSNPLLLLIDLLQLQ